ncbi:MAG: DNA recombination protein RmuC, partial [Clostridiales bacterium]|nr:DNA recombination protein RmuC [Clostridiales bacterium]
VMFLPFEGLYAEAVNMGMMEYCQKECRVMLAGPSTMAALLNSLQMGFKTLAIQKRSGEVWKVLSEVKKEFDSFALVLDKTQLRLNQASSELDTLIGTRTRKIQRALSDIQEIGGPDEDMGDS